MSTADRTPVVLALLDDLVRSYVESHAPPGGCSDADLLYLSDGLALAVDHGAVAALWPPTDHDHSDAALALDVLLDDVTPDPSTSRTAYGAAIVGLARRLADVAASLLVRGDAHRHEAAALWDAASRLLGVGGARDGHRTSDHLEQAARDLASLQEQVAELTRQRDEARLERDRALAPRTPGPGPEHSKAQAPAPWRTPGRWPDLSELRRLAIYFGATECAVFVAPGEVAVIIDSLRTEGGVPVPFESVALRVLGSVHLDDPRTYVVRTAGPAEERQQMRETPEERRARRAAVSR